MPNPTLVAPVTMSLLPLDQLGPRVDHAAGQVTFGLLLPLVGDQTSREVCVRMIHEKDQFLKAVPARTFTLTRGPDLPDYGNYWSGTVPISTADRKGDHWGDPGRYVYRFVLTSADPKEKELDWIIDPFAREFGVGKLSAFTLGYERFEWGEAEQEWKVPDIRDLVLYELMITEFAGGLRGVVEHLDYLTDLGVNCIEIMPVSHTTGVVDWGYTPNGYFGADERLGQRRDVQSLIQEAHARKIAVVMDAVYGHTDGTFPYEYVYKNLGRPNPFMGDFAKNIFGPNPDFNKKLTNDFYFTVNYFWLDRMHVDGFRYDCVPEYWGGVARPGYADLVYNTYEMVKECVPNDHWQRFAGEGINLIQCGEQLECPEVVTWSTYSNSVWQNQTRDEAVSVAHGDRGAVERLGFRLGLTGYPTVVTTNSDTIAKAPLQYLDNHDHERFICQFGLDQSAGDPLLWEGDRSHWYKLQPYLIGLFTGKGAPLMWQGMEVCENYFLPDTGWGRVRMFRPMRWEYFYTEEGRSTIRLVRRLAALRRSHAHLRRGDHYFYNHYDNYQSKGVLMFSREDASAFSLIALNFGDWDQPVPFTFGLAGDYREELDGQDNKMGIQAGQTCELRIPSNYGRVWTVQK